MYCANGDKYEGDWRDNQKDGYGRYTWKNGDIYEGIFEKGVGELTYRQNRVNKISSKVFTHSSELT